MLSSDLIYIARRRAALTQAELGRRLSLPQSQISRWERGDVQPSLETLTRIVRACGLELTLGLANGDDSYDLDIEEYLELAPEQRTDHALRRAEFVVELQTPA
ncbi:MAG: helix-turn-helix domain-containing protein [Gaiellaceae bacterium]